MKNIINIFNSVMLSFRSLPSRHGFVNTISVLFLLVMLTLFFSQDNNYLVVILCGGASFILTTFLLDKCKFSDNIVLRTLEIGLFFIVILIIPAYLYYIGAPIYCVGDDSSLSGSNPTENASFQNKSTD